MTSLTDSNAVADLIAIARKYELIDTWYVRGSTVVVTKGSATYSTDVFDAPRFLREMIEKHEASRNASGNSEITDT